MGEWDVVYALSVLAGLETSVLIDAEDVISIDWGTSGHVQLSPPVGCKAPFKLWVHTHLDLLHIGLAPILAVCRSALVSLNKRWYWVHPE